MEMLGFSRTRTYADGRDRACDGRPGHLGVLTLSAGDARLCGEILGWHTGHSGVVPLSKNSVCRSF